MPQKKIAVRNRKLCLFWEIMTDSMPRLRNSNDIVHMEFSPTGRKDAFHKQKIVYIRFYFCLSFANLIWKLHEPCSFYLSHKDKWKTNSRKKRKTDWIVESSVKPWFWFLFFNFSMMTPGKEPLGFYSFPTLPSPKWDHTSFCPHALSLH